MGYNQTKAKNTREREDWYHCPKCGKGLFPVLPSTIVEHLHLQCRGCRRIIEVNIRRAESLEPRAD